jgi:cyanate lyase
MGIQTTTIEIDQLTAIILRAKAEAEGLTMTDLLRSMAETEAFKTQSTFFETASPEERARAVEEWANRTRSTAPPLPDCAINRDAIYAERENKQL